MKRGKINQWIQVANVSSWDHGSKKNNETGLIDLKQQQYYVIVCCFTHCLKITVFWVIVESSHED